MAPHFSLGKYPSAYLQSARSLHSPPDRYSPIMILHHILYKYYIYVYIYAHSIGTIYSCFSHWTSIYEVCSPYFPYMIIPLKPLFIIGFTLVYHNHWGLSWSPHPLTSDQAQEQRGAWNDSAQPQSHRWSRVSHAATGWVQHVNFWMLPTYGCGSKWKT